MADQLPAGYKLDLAPTLPAGYKLDAQSQSAAQPAAPAGDRFLDSYWNSIKGAFTGVYNDLRPHSRAEKLAAVHDAVDNADKYVHGTDEEKAAAKDKMIGALPGGGTALKVRDGDYAGAAGDVAGMATLGAAGNVALGDGAFATGARGAIKGGAKGAIEPVKYGRFQLPVPASLAGAGLGGSAAFGAGLPKTLGAVAGAATPIVKGAIRGAKTALADRLAAIGEKSAAAERATSEAAAQAAPKRLPAAPDASYVRSVPAEYPPPPAPKGLLGPGPSAPIIPPAPPAPPDASFVRSVPAEYPPVEGATPAPAAIAAPAENMVALDGLAQSLNGTSFAKASPESQAMIRTLASRLDKPIPAELNTPPVAAPRTPMAAPEPAAPSKSLQQMIQEELAAKRASAVPPPTERPPAPATAPVPQAPPTPEVSPEETSPVLESPRSGFTSSGEVKSPQLRAAEITGANRANRASVMAKALHENGIPLSDAKNITTEQWESLSKSTGGQVPSQQTIDATLSELGKLGRSPGQAALADAVERNGTRTAASKAKLKPQQ